VKGVKKMTASCVLFIEYDINENRWNLFIEKASGLSRSVKERHAVLDHRFLLSAEQSGKVVEVIRMTGLDEARALRQERLEATEGIFAECRSWTDGQMRAWVFRELF
jgi:hypothetical protein